MMLPKFVTIVAILILLALHAPASAACKQVKAEATIFGIHIGDKNSAVKVIGTSMQPGLPREEQDKDAAGIDQSFPYIRFASRDGRQELKLFIHYGDVVDSYNEVEVAPVPAGVSKAKRLSVAVFATEHGVKLGIREADLVRLLGACFKRIDAAGGAHEIQYAIDDENHPLLKKSGMPSYYAHYRFRAGRLVRIQFGFDYP